MTDTSRDEILFAVQRHTARELDMSKRFEQSGHIENLLAFINSHDSARAFYNPQTGKVHVLGEYTQTMESGEWYPGFKVEIIAPSLKAARDWLGY